MDITDSLNVADLPGNEPFQVLEEGTDLSEGTFHLSAGQSPDEAVQKMSDRTQRLSERD